MIKKNMLAKHLQFSQKQRKHFLFIERDETRKNVYSQTSRQQVPPPQTHPPPLTPSLSPLPTVLHTTLSTSPPPVYQSLFLPLPFWVWLIFVVLMFNFNIYTKHVRTCSCSRSEKFICYCLRDMPAVWTTHFLVPLSPSAAAPLGGFYWQFDWKVAGSTCGVCLMRPLTCVEYLKVSNKWGGKL